MCRSRAAYRAQKTNPFFICSDSNHLNSILPAYLHPYSTSTIHHFGLDPVPDLEILQALPLAFIVCMNRFQSQSFKEPSRKSGQRSHQGGESMLTDEASHDQSKRGRSLLPASFLSMPCFPTSTFLIVFGSPTEQVGWANRFGSWGGPKMTTMR